MKTKEIAKMMEFKMNLLVKVSCIATDALSKRDGTLVNVLKVTYEPCNTLKSDLILKFNLQSDIYGESQKFHITTNLKSDELIGTELIFNKCEFSKMVIG